MDTAEETIKIVEAKNYDQSELSSDMQYSQFE